MSYSRQHWQSVCLQSGHAMFHSHSHGGDSNSSISTQLNPIHFSVVATLPKIGNKTNYTICRGVVNKNDAVIL